MSVITSIEWTDHTFNYWEGCTMVSPGCANCYAWLRNKRFHGGKNWGKGAPRLLRSEDYRRQPLKWNRLICDKCLTPALPGATPRINQGCMDPICGGSYRRPRVFCSSLADWLDDEVPIEWLAGLLELVYLCGNLDWQLLTKRPQNWMSRIENALIHAQGGDPKDKDWFVKHGDTFPSNEFSDWLNEWTGGIAPQNIWIGTTVEDQKRADQRIPALMRIPARVRFLSCEPLLEKIDLYKCFKTCWSYHIRHGAQSWRELPAREVQWNVQALVPAGWKNGVDWVICGGESGPGARPMHPDFALTIRDQCYAAKVPFFFKQWGEWAPPDVIRLHRPDYDPEDGVAMGKVGKKAAGRFLDGVEHNQFPDFKYDLQIAP